ncbi:glycosyltransferase family 4 protein [Pseudanabaenaceae cyanobacterium LEGE 13415]|nr:glycosyltransferase family 4 protein [Pseudanabaenaceae cyanobacterium LEGE 13415]
MRICHVIYIPRFSGAEILVRELAIAHQALGHDVAVMALFPSEPSFLGELGKMEAMGISLFLPEQRLEKWDRLNFLIQGLKQFKPDVVVAHSIIPSAYIRIAVKFAFLSRTATISVLHDASQDDYAPSKMRSLERWIIPKPDAVVSVSQIGADNYSRRIRSSKKPLVIPNGIDLSRITQAASHREAVREQVFTVQPEEFVFLQVGRFGSTKQQHLSLEAFAKVHQIVPFSGKLCFVGCSENEAYEEELRQLAKKFQVEEKVLFLGSRSDIPELLAGADIFLMPSKFEAQGIAFIEALTSGISVIASEIPPFEYGRAFAGVHLIQPQRVDQFAQAIAEVIRHGSVRWERDTNSYSMEQTSEAYLALFQSLTYSKQ